MGITEVVWRVAPNWNEVPSTRKIRNLTGDLAYKYIDNAGRELYFYAYGDLPEIRRRLLASGNHRG